MGALPALRPRPLAIDLQSVAKVYARGAERLTVFDGVDFQVPEGGFVAIAGRSGSGKTTLLSLVAGLDRPSSGRLVVAGEALGLLSENERARWRSRNMGFIFQDCGLISVLDAAQSLELPLSLLALPRRERRDRALHALEIVGLGGRAGYRPSQLSADERQRLAIARAIVTDPTILLADEPTSRLDPGNVKRMLTLLLTLNRDFGKTLVMVTRDPDAAARADVHYELDEGVLRIATGVPVPVFSARTAARSLGGRAGP
jgi:putative ABC transport system ATP-binding protein